jgi:hypothetical protein
MKNNSNQGPKKKRRKLIDADDTILDQQRPYDMDPSVYGIVYYESEKEEKERLRSERLQSLYHDEDD